ncbi:hypothetical protein [Calothrix sp. NIES-3974]|uniref:hypothetical protein n=1 Tax=Calothrix sp. NIES-3974 TaxID=2005462 RepID=UPI000B5E3E2A|nr:hypothetical protein [Calothrix sp. NIES-3974]BAZ06497.1 hypothetical protein NIES3974_31580 [Calothrix sp. NIES-3974]
MAVIRLVLIFVVIGSVTLLVIQNFSPSLAIKFLGMRSQALPFSIWVLISIVAGALTSLIISSLLRLSSFKIGGKQESFTPPSPPRPPQSPRERVATKNPSPQPDVEPRVNRDLDEWEQTASEDWDFEDDVVQEIGKRDRPHQTPKTDYSTNVPRDKHRNTRDFDDDLDEDLFTPDQQQTSKSPAKPGSDSTYSYNYREPKQTGVGKTESVYDADYRVLVPPFYPKSEQQSPPDNYQENNQNNPDDDWGFLDELDGEDTKNTKNE